MPIKNITSLITIFRKSPYCTPDARTYEAEIDDLNIVCGEFSVETENIFLSPEDEIFLPIKVLDTALLH